MCGLPGSFKKQKSYCLLCSASLAVLVISETIAYVVVTLLEFSILSSSKTRRQAAIILTVEYVHDHLLVLHCRSENQCEMLRVTSSFVMLGQSLENCSGSSIFKWSHCVDE